MKFFIKISMFAAITGAFSFSWAQPEGLLNKLLAPGPLIEGHKNLEGKDCLKCHDAGQGISNTKCMDCHKDIKKSFDAKAGFHGLNTQACFKCHSDHKGRDFDSTQVDTKNFDHTKLTGYALEGKHAGIKCLECHKEKRINKMVRKNEVKFFGQASTCVSCHKKDDIHFFKGDFAKKDCRACHTNKSWQDQIKFNHNTDTKFKLQGRHAEMKCNECHQPDKKQKTARQYAWPNMQAAQCLACHQDQHKNKLSSRFSGGNCTTCHTQTQWKIEKFKHELTSFKLNGRHAETACIDCHKPAVVKGVKNKGIVAVAVKNLNFTGLKNQCLSCHQDFHKFGSFKSAKMGDLNQCLKCHTEKDWQQTHTFDHSKNTRFALDGEHLSLKCSSCHLPTAPAKKAVKNIFTVKAPTYHWKNLDQKTCENCHKSPHIGVFSAKLLQQKCTSCHTTDGWSVTKAGSGFDHSKTRFSLTGAHKTTKCADCHTVQGKQVFKFKSTTEQLCLDCHTNVHKDQFSPQFSAQACTQCHTTQNFTERISFDHNKTKFILNGEHANLKCIECHKPTAENHILKWPNFKSKDHASPKAVVRGVFKFPEVQEKSCVACHSDFHKGQLSTNCSECHSEKSWKPTSFVHNKQSEFKLKEKHEKLACIKCHLPTKDTIVFKNQKRAVIKFKPLASTCFECHKDPHKGNFGRNCQECHTEKSWGSTKDFHKNFTLTGVHYSLDCTECHKENRKLSGLSQQCLACHQKDDVHNGMLPNCKSCHTQHFWEASKFRHSLTRFPLRGSHRTLDCAECHTNGVYKGLSSTCVNCHLPVFLANPGPHGTGNTNCIECHRNTFTFKSAN